MRSVNSAYWLGLQQDRVNLSELIDLSTRTNAWKWTTTNQTIVNSGNEYTPFPGVPVSGVEESIDLGISFIDFIISNSGSVVNDLLKGGEFSNSDLTIRRVHTHSPNLGAMTIYKGKLGEYTFNRLVISGRMRSVLGAVQTQWPYHTYMDQCAWKFGGTGCSFDPSSITLTGSIEVSSNQYIMKVSSPFYSDSAYATDHFQFGRMAFTTGANSGVIRTVFANTGDFITLSQKVPFAVNSGDQFSLYRGCKKSLLADCKSVYNNTSNFLGFPWIPKQENAF